MEGMERRHPLTSRPSRPSRLGLALGSLLLLAPVLAACGSSSSGSTESTTGTAPGGKATGTITLYSAQHEQTTSSLVKAFTQQTGIKVRVVNNDEDVLTAQIEQEGSRSPADVFYTENSNWLTQLDQKSLLATVDASTLASVPKADSATNGSWVGVSARISGVVFNPDKVPVSQLPHSILDLDQKKWKGKFELAPAETDFWPLVSSVIKAKGEDAAKTWLEGLKDNASDANVPDNETVTSDVDKGTTPLGIINHYYFYRTRSEVGASSFHARFATFTPQDPGYVEDISGAGVLKSSKNPAAAQAFLAFLTSDAGQTILAHSVSYEYPIHPGVAANSELPPLSSLHPTDFTPADLGTGLDAKALLQEVGLL
jgi:iron(III) transport system substrate-binding protein